MEPALLFDLVEGAVRANGWEIRRTADENRGALLEIALPSCLYKREYHAQYSIKPGNEIPQLHVLLGEYPPAIAEFQVLHFLRLLPLREDSAFVLAKDQPSVWYRKQFSPLGPFTRRLIQDDLKIAAEECDILLPLFNSFFRGEEVNVGRITLALEPRPDSPILWC
jgi:hypothetical protein